MEKDNVLHREGVTINRLCQKSQPVKYSLLKYLGQSTAGNELWCTLVVPKWEELCAVLCSRAAGAGSGLCG